MNTCLNFKKGTAWTGPNLLYVSFALNKSISRGAINLPSSSFPPPTLHAHTKNPSKRRDKQKHSYRIFSSAPHNSFSGSWIVGLVPIWKLIRNSMATEAPDQVPDQAPEQVPDQTPDQEPDQIKKQAAEEAAAKFKLLLDQYEHSLFWFFCTLIENLCIIIW